MLVYSQARKIWRWRTIPALVAGRAAWKRSGQSVAARNAASAAPCPNTAPAAKTVHCDALGNHSPP